MGLHFDQPYQIRGVYYLESGNQNMNPIAIRPAISPPDYMAWEDTGHGRVIHVSKVLIDGKTLDAPPSKLPDKIEVISDSGEKYKFVKLTKKIFDEKLKSSVARGGSMDFQNDDELQEHYLRSGFGPDAG